MKRPWRSLGAAIVCAAVLVPVLTTFARSSGTAPKPPPVKHVSNTAPKLRLAMPDTIATVDPALVADDENVQLAQLLYSGLVRLDANYHVVPDAAARYSVSADHKVYTFHLRKGLRFSNGDPVRAQDFAYSITRSLNPSLKSPSAPTYLLDIQGAQQVSEGKATRVSGIKVMNASTLQITTRWPMPYFLMELTYPASFVLDSKVISKLGAPDNTSWYANPVGSGPFKLKRWVQNDQMVLTRNPNYYGPRPDVGTVSISLTPFADTGTTLYKYIAKSLDVVALPSSATSLGKLPGIRQASMLAVAGVYMNCQAKPFDDLRVRRAFTLALPRKQLVAKAMGRVAHEFSGFVPPGEWGYDPGLKVQQYSVAEARRQLALAGFPKGKGFPSTTLYFGADPANPDLAKRILKLAQRTAKAWKTALNIPISVKSLTLNTLYTRAQSNSLPIYFSGWSADYPDPHDWLSGQWKSHALNNNVRYSNPTFDTLVSKADATWKPAKRLSYYNQAQDVLVNDDAWIPLYVPYRLVYVRPGITNLVLTGYGLIPRAGTWADVHVPSATQSRNAL